ncbi:Hormone-sensitive lipase [Halotydeus destructor]|nr:Hormone-sensitive lipase [Halotydeus destructor]
MTVNIQSTKYVKEMARMADTLYVDLSVKYEDNSLIRARVGVLLDFGLEVASYVHEYDFRGVEANGYRSLIRLTLLLLKHGLTIDRTLEETFQRLLELFVDGIPHVRQLREDSLRATEVDGKPLLTSSDVKYSSDFLTKFVTMDISKLELFFGPMCNFSCDENTIYLNYLLWTKPGGMFDFLRAMMNSSKRSHILAELFKAYDLNTIKKQLNEGSTGFFYTKFLNYTLNWWRPSVKKTLIVPRQTKWRILCDLKDKKISLEHNAEHSRSSIYNGVRCRFIHEPDDKPVLIIYAHGGGFISNVAETHEVFLKGWLTNLPGVAILNVDYTLAPEARFPDPVQELLDVYLWAASATSSVTASLGFKPTTIALAGDSSGALMCMSVLTIIADIRRMGHQVPLPVGFLGVYSTFTVAPQMLPSQLLSPFNPLLFPTIILNMGNAFSPVTTAYLGPNNNETESDHLDLHKLIADGQLETYFHDNLEIFKHPYMSPLNYGHFEDLKTVKLKLFALHSDPLLDNSVTMARRWRGHVTLDVIDTLQHAFFNMMFLKMYSEKRRIFYEAEQIIFKRIREMFSIDQEDVIKVV